MRRQGRCVRQFLLVFAAITFSLGHAWGQTNSPALPPGVIPLDQGWTDDQRTLWYTTTQGSRLVPLDWMLNLEAASSTSAQPKKFAEDLARLGYLPNPVTARNPHKLPLGFVVDHEPTRAADLMCDTFPETCDAKTMRKPWVGLNCSACHTNDIRFGGKAFRVEGSATLADFQAMEEEMLKALKATADDPERFDRFARAVLDGEFSDETSGSLNRQLLEHVAWQQKLEDKNRSKVRYGHGRLDAQGHILNKVSLVARVQDQLDTVAADAPASYPFIWNTSQQQKIQWNGIADNQTTIDIFGIKTDVGALVRNTSEVIGVFAHIETDRGKAFLGYDSSVRLKELIGLERQLAALKSPRWPETILPPIDGAKAARGKAIFDAMGCANCHQPLAWDDLTSDAREKMVQIKEQKTDVFLACNTFLHISKSGNQGGQKVYGVTGDRIGEIDATRNMLVNAVVGAVIGKFDELLAGVFTNVFPPDKARVGALVRAENALPGVSDSIKKSMAAQCLSQDNHPLLAYKARPLNGVWATAPYLHNGSVPTLYDLLLPAKVKNVGAGGPDPVGPTRPEIFAVGSREFDPVKVGFKSDVIEDSTDFVFRVRDEATGEPIPGNYNSGHEYGSGQLTEEQRLELVEYLKTL
ncbi:conserved exported hypothetical protein [Mesorhizobium prunaredense]|uniref:Cytochrome c domain-containing protein n=1 Tax=Mesorhizobium prunaredense TaxID=1631249 RepID=A0A1R3VBD0_9HYPH|nr:di-heme-cytochrome C peroxidase [Mesorhizobium prunaredense]SIT57236.1 conserved exported hypothetical protein [Mesorhizobium prunaredense]